jgi:hypothetical protein
MESAKGMASHAAHSGRACAPGGRTRRRSAQQLAAAVAIVEKEHGEAEKQLVVDQLMVAIYTLIRLLRSSSSYWSGCPARSFREPFIWSLIRLAHSIV